MSWSVLYILTCFANPLPWNDQLYFNKVFGSDGANFKDLNVLERIGFYFHSEITGENLHTLDALGKTFRDDLDGQKTLVSEYNAGNFYVPLVLAFM
jgi:SNF family Na+-dependent transporter